jgi:RAT1-interacting protein
MAETSETVVPEQPHNGGAPPNYADAKYWDDRYIESSDPFEWYETWWDVRPVVAEMIKGKKRALNIGCGNSPMATDALSDFEHIVNIDISSVVIKQMTDTFGSLPNVEFLVMDCMALSFDADAFDVVLDKGTLDALFCGSNAMSDVSKTLREVHRVLRPGGVFIDVTYGRPPSRLPVFRDGGLSWTVLEPMKVSSQTRCASHWVYVFRKPIEEGVVTDEIIE